jgi:hypothetical protein
VGSEALNKKALDRRGGSEGQADDVSSSNRVEQLQSRFDFADWVKRTVALGVSKEDADESPRRQESYVSPGELGPRLLDPYPQIGKEADHSRLEIHSAVEREAPQDRVESDRGQVAKEGDPPLPFSSY